MSEPADYAVRRDVPWSEALTAEYLAEAAPSAAACNSALIEVCAVCDRVIAGTLLMNLAHTGYETRTVLDAAGANPQPEVGRYLTAAARTGDLRPMSDATRTAMHNLGQSDEQIAFTVRRQETALALMQIGREIGLSSAGGLERGAGWVQIAVVGGLAAAAALVGLAVDWYCAHQSRATLAQRTTQAGMMNSARNTAERMRVFAETGTMPPETDVERAAAESIRAAAAQAREAGFGQQVGQAVSETVSGLGKVAMGIGVVIVGIELLKARKGS